METLKEHTITPPAETHPTKPRRLSSFTILGAAVAAIVVLALALSLFEWSSENGKVSRLQNLSSLRASATKAADTYAIAFGSYDYRNLHGPTAPWTVVEDHATARFRTDYQKTSSALQQTIVTYKATAKASVPISAVSSISSSKAVVLLELSQTITNSTQKNGPQSQQFIVVMTLLRQKGQWLINDVQASL